MPKDNTPEKFNITDEAVARYLEGVCRAGEKERIEEAMKNDPDFKKELDDLREIVGDFDPNAGTGVPKHVVRRAQDLVHPRYGALFIDILAEITAGAFRRLSTAATVLCGPQTAEPVMLRGESFVPKQNILVEKRVGDLDIQVAVGIHADNRQITVCLRRADTGRDADGVRGLLLLEGQELESHLSARGRIAFDEVGDGEYFVELRQGDALLGAVKINLTSHG